MKNLYNFCAGPAHLPHTVLEQSAQALLDFEGTGLSVVELSHRSPEIGSVLDEARLLVRDLLEVPDAYAIFFMHGGASLQFPAIPLNLLSKEGRALYINTGTWAKKAWVEADMIGRAAIIASSEEDNFRYIPKDYKIDEAADYFYFTANNTIYGTQFHHFPQTNLPLVSDMTSELFSRTLDWSRFGMVYAGAQKNLGPAGVALCIVREDLLGKSGRRIPSMLDYQKQIAADNKYNTPPVLAIYMSLLMLRWYREQGGVAEMERRSRRKAEKLYTEIDRNPLFVGTACVEDRSLMNATFVLKDPVHAPLFDQICADSGVVALKGHRSVGGYRASLYNPIPEMAVDQLINCMNGLLKKV